MLDIINVNVSYKKNQGLGNMKENRRILLVLGILLCLAGAGFMFDGEILGETTTNIVTILGITGMGLIATQKKAINNGGE